MHSQPKTAAYLIALSLIPLQPEPGQALIRLQVQQIGADVVITGSGSANTAALVSSGSDLDWTNVLADNQIYAGPNSFGDGSGSGADVSLWSSISGPAIFGNNGSIVLNPDQGNGDFFGILASEVTAAPLLVLPLGYISGTALNGTSTFQNQSITTFGITPGSLFTWIWGDTEATDSLVLEVQKSAAPSVPAPLPMIGAAIALAQSRRLRRRVNSSHA